jgi:hypothetical protein
MYSHGRQLSLRPEGLSTHTVRNHCSLQVSVSHCSLGNTRVLQCNETSPTSSLRSGCAISSIFLEASVKVVTVLVGSPASQSDQWQCRYHSSCCFFDQQTMGSEMADNKLGTPSLPAFYQSSAPRKSGRLYLVFCVLASLFLVNVCPSFQCHSRAESDEQVFWHPPEHPGAYPNSNTSVPGRTDDVQFDHYSLILKGHRVFLQYVGTSARVTSQKYSYCNSSGEFHTWRLPVPSLWPDILEKAKAAGLNAISIYTHMGLLNPSRGIIDFDGFRALKPLYEAAMAAGIWVVVRPGWSSINWM